MIAITGLAGAVLAVNGNVVPASGAVLGAFCVALLRARVMASPGPFEAPAYASS